MRTGPNEFIHAQLDWGVEDQDRFALFLRASNYRPYTSLLILGAVKHWVDWNRLETGREIILLTPSMIVKYMNVLLSNLESMGQVSGYIQQQLWSLGIWQKYLQLTGRVDKGAFRAPTRIRARPTDREILSEQQIISLWNVCHQTEEHMVVLLAYGCGLRRNEIATLQWQHVHTGQGLISIIHGKGGHYRAVPIPEVCTSWWTHAAQLPHKAEDYLFWPASSRRAAGKRMANLLKVLCMRAECETAITLHQLRHTFATHLADHGMDVQSVQKLLGHQSPATTAHYMVHRRSTLELLY